MGTARGIAQLAGNTARRDEHRPGSLYAFGRGQRISSNHAEYEDGERVLDVACGTGIVATFQRDMFGAAAMSQACNRYAGMVAR